MSYFSDQEFNSENTPELAENLEFEYCQFYQVDFTDKDLSGIRFVECEFSECDFSNVALRNTSFQECKIDGSKMIGLSFDDVNSFNFSIQFNNTILNHSVFYQVNLQNSLFDHCTIQGADFTEANLENTKLINSNLNNSVFNRTNLKSTNFLGSSNFSINPNENYLKGAIFSKDEIAGLLDVFELKIK
jgi:uncharacterized protein YjbI with pentapeptide repeats